ncbi:MAG: glycosyltransferase family 39 protein [Candidatus Aureabacteria bacterium]|nr:glycosyltransferase family 39 protein [Candidatus Auribacterota bacterium]
MQTRKILFLLMLIIAVAAFLRFYDLTYQSIWGDEACSVYDAQGVDLHFITASLVDATHRKFVNPRPAPRAVLTACLKNEGTPPAFFAVLALWIRAFGAGDFACRALSAVMGVMAVPVIYLLGRRLFRRADAALLAALFMAVSPAAIFFSQEVRAYGMANLLALASSWLFLRALDGGRRVGPWLSYAATALVLCYTFYFAALVLAAHVAYLFAADRRGLRPWLCAMASVGLCYLPWLAFGFRTQIAVQLAVSSGYSRPGPVLSRESLSATAGALRYILDSLILGPMYSRVLITDTLRRIIEFGTLALVLSGGYVLWRRERKPALLFTLLFSLTPLIVISVFSIAKGTLWFMKPRYHLWEASGIFILAAASITSIRHIPLRFLLAGAVCAASLLAGPYHFYPMVFYSDHAKSDFRSAAALIAAEERRGDLIFVNIPGHMIPFNIYYKGGLRQVGISDCGRYVLREKLEQYTKNRQAVWFLVGLDTLGHGDAEIAEYLGQRFPLKHTHELHGLRLAHYERTGLPPG